MLGDDRSRECWGETVALTHEEELELIRLLEEEAHVQSGRKFWTYFPETGPYARALYSKHLEAFRAGATHRVRIVLAGNRVGKTESIGLYETVCHARGEYPPWWEGRRFQRPVDWWIAGETNETTRDILQRKLLGPVGQFGTGVLPRAWVHRVRPRSGVTDAIELVEVKHVTGGISRLQFKSYQQGIEAFPGTERDGVLLDEEPPLEIFTECLLRTMSTGRFGGGMLLLTFTPLQGRSETVMHFLPTGELPEHPSQGNLYIVNISWDDVPHLNAVEKAEFKHDIPPYQLDARTRGIPVLGAGVIYPVPEETYLVEPFELPKHWRRAYAMDVGWNRTAGLWGAFDSETDTWYCYHEHYRGQAEPSVHVQAMKAPGGWIPGVIDPAARGRSQSDGRQLMQEYIEMGLVLAPANNAVESGIYAVWERLSQGRCKIFTSLTHLRKELRVYRRDKRGAIIKVDDHLCDDLRYLIMSGKDIAIPVPVEKVEEPDPAMRFSTSRGMASHWMNG